jgi:Immunity protein 35
MLSIEDGRKIALQKIQGDWNIPNDTPILLDERTVEKSHYWIFFYTSKLWFDTKDLKYAIAGNSPLFISKETGEINTYRTGLSVEQMIEEHERLKVK